MIGNRMFVAGVVATAALVALPVSAQSAQKVGVIEVQRIVQDSAVGKESLARIQKVSAAKQEDLTKKFYEVSEKVYKNAAPQDRAPFDGGAAPGADGQYYDGDVK